MLSCAWLTNPFLLLLLKYFLWYGTSCFFMHPRPFRRFFIITSVILTNSAPILCSWLSLSQENLESSTVWKYKLYYYSGMGWPTDQELTALEEILCYTQQFPRRRGTSLHRGTHGEALGTVRRQRDWGESTGQEPFFWFSREGMSEAE